MIYLKEVKLEIRSPEISVLFSAPFVGKNQVEHQNCCGFSSLEFMKQKDIKIKFDVQATSTTLYNYVALISSFSKF